VNFITVLLLLAIIGREIWHIVQFRGRGARLHVQITTLFSVVAVGPAVLVAVVASVNLDRRLDRQFLIRVGAIMENSAIVSEAYLDDHKRSIRAETNFMAADVALAKPQFDQDIAGSAASSSPPRRCCVTCRLR
jgi:two-component system, NtrC family, nitrogen regulation sensor histidine kinase NtrY